MTDYLIAPPAEYLIPVTRGADRQFTIQRVDGDNEPVDYDEGSTVWIDIDTDEPAQVEATVTGANAAFVLPSATLDLVRNRAKWRIIWSLNEVETPLLVGRFERHDG